MRSENVTRSEVGQIGGRGVEAVGQRGRVEIGDALAGGSTATTAAVPAAQAARSAAIVSGV
ncbi:hypothetical protein [Rhodococcus sp. EPR-134]|uniref:hypothetical protein n=1 Tax=Rhodococcus sp. EPR-134 TaxID=1813675 RepID=UPI0012E8CD0A|nr:hypothetical protein [Rhodococcus sp. EPR-134]